MYVFDVVANFNTLQAIQASEVRNMHTPACQSITMLALSSCDKEAHLSLGHNVSELGARGKV